MFKYIECACMTPDHTLRFYKDEYGQMYVECHLRRDTLIKRLRYAILYVFGKQSRYGAFEETVINVVDQKKLKEILDDKAP